MLRRLGIRGKVLAALSVPVLVLFMFAGALSWQSVQELQTARTVTTLLGALQQSRDVVAALQAERRTAMSRVAGTLEDSSEVVASREAVDDAVTRLESRIRTVTLEDLDPRIAAEVENVRDAVDRLEALRQRVSGGTPPPLVVVMRDYSSIVDVLVAFPQRVGHALDDRQLGAILAAHADVLSTVDHYSREQALGSELLLATARDGEVDQNLMIGVASLFPVSDAVHEEAQLAVASLGLGDTVVVPPLGASFNGHQEYKSHRVLIQTGDRQRISFTREVDWTGDAAQEIAAFDTVQNELRQIARTQANDTAAAAVRTAILTIAVSLAAVVVSVLIALAISRQITRPLRRLTEAAAQVRDELPHLVEQVAIPGQGPDLSLTQIPVDSKDEVGRLATAFNEVNATTVEVAQEQAALRASIAEMFVNVARRDQVLLNRQLSFIDALERSEEDPKTLADLFRLDHLATRMRRNAESLLVLAGIDTGRRLREPIPTSDVIRTASSEIEHYERVQLDLPVDPLMLGHTALPAAHMLAEILENATVFSDPGTPVHVSTGIDETHVVITVQDQGLGMNDGELEAANTKIRTTSAGDVLGSQRLGLYVVGRIATRLGATVTLSRGSDNRGTLVTVRMPLVLFVDPSSIPLTAPSASPRVETFVLPEEAAAAAHDAAYAPAPAGVQDVAPGALGSAENPAEEVDLATFVEGVTEGGLPKRRSRPGDAPVWDMSGGDAAHAPAIPLAPNPDALAGATTGGEEAWQPPLVQTSAPLTQRRATDPPAAPEVPAASPSGGGLPTRRPASPPAGGLPTRTPSTATGGQAPVPQSAIGSPTATGLPTRRPVPGSPTAPEAVDASRATGPENVEGRTAMFQGFRSRRAELAAAAVQEAGHVEAEDGASDAVERLAAAAAGNAAFFRRQQTPAEAAPEEETFVVPALADDDDEFGDPAFAPDAPAAEKPAEPEADGSGAEPWQPWQPVPAADAPWHAAEPAESAQPVPSAPAPAAEPWQPVPAADAPWHAAEPAEPAESAQPVPSAPAPAAEQAAPVQPWAAQSPAAPSWPQAVPESAPAATSPWSATGASAERPGSAEQAPPPPPVETAAPVGPPAPVPTEPYAFGSSVDFAGLVQGPTRRSMREQSHKRRWFRRNRDAGPASPQPTAPPAPPAPPSMLPSEGFGPAVSPMAARMAAERSAPEPLTASEALPTSAQDGGRAAESSSPLRQSAWGGAPVGSHVGPPAPEAAAEPAASTAQPWAPQNGTPAFAPPETGTDSGKPSPWAPAQGWEPPPAPTPVPAPVTETPAEPGGGNGQAWAPVPGWGPDESWPQRETSRPEPTQQRPPAPAATPASGPATAPGPAPAPAPAPAEPGRPAAPAASGSPYAGQTSFTPQPMFGFDDEMTNMLAQRADIAQQALAELNQLSNYRPQAVAGGGGSKLARRTPSAVPAAPAITTSSSQRPARDANQVRSLLSSFQSGTSRGRQLADGGSGPQDSGGHGPAGSEDGSGPRAEPVTTPDTDLNPRDASW